MDIKNIDMLPHKPGVYKFYDKNHKILYVGKSINLHNRVRSYFSDDLLDRPYVKQMIPLISTVEIEETNNEIESLVLESALIKEHQPKYNSDLKDDKSYSWIYISTKEQFPTVKIKKQITTEELKKGELFGPYPNSSSTKRIFTYLRKMYPFCTCNKPRKECMYFHLGLCPGPYQGHISKEDYRKNINEIIKFLKGRKRGQISTLEKQMHEYSKNMEYEKAAVLRDRINDLKYLGEKISFDYGEDSQTYVERRKKTLYQHFYDLKIELNLKKLHRIECYDVSNIQGKMAYTSMVVALDGEIKRNQYRIFKIKSMDTPNDPLMLKETLTRRFNPERQSNYESSPDIVLIDGGKSQLGIVQDAVPHNICLLGISKGKRFKRKGAKLLDEFWYVNRDTGEVTKINIKNKSILIDLRDEAHRFAITHHRKERIRQGEASLLEKIDGIGDKSRKKLLKSFGSIENIKKASIEDINNVLNNKTISTSVFRYFHTPSKK